MNRLLHTKSGCMFVSDCENTLDCDSLLAEYHKYKFGTHATNCMNSSSESDTLSLES